jgi:hypothetical protein
MQNFADFFCPQHSLNRTEAEPHLNFGRILKEKYKNKQTNKLNQ